jgi:hypothetical protein
VVENLEKVLRHEDLMRELGSLITLLDNPDYAKYNVKLLIVGVPSGVRDYFATTEDQATVANRIQELPITQSLTASGVLDFCRKGFYESLRVTMTNEQLQKLAIDVHHATLGIPQRLHELCLELAFAIEANGWRYSAPLLVLAKYRWVMGSLSVLYANIEAVMNERATKTGRRNQVLYALTLIDKEKFRANHVEDLVRREFPESAGVKALGINQILTHLATRSSPIIRRSIRGEAYQFADLRYQICMRCMLTRSEDGTVGKLEFGN